jgi:serine protease Do
MIPKQTALLNNVPQGAYVTDVVSDSPASKAGIQIEDIITKFDGVELNEDSEKTLSDLIAAKKVGESVTVTIWRNDEIKDITAILQASNQQ